MPRGHQPPRHALAVAAVAFVALAGFQAWELSGLRAPDLRADETLIRPGACVVSDEISLAIAANRFTADSAGCPDVLDSLATTLVAANGVSVQGGAKALPQVAADWERIFARADYVWLSGSSARRIPWTPGLHAWFARNFRPLNPPRGELSEGKVYVHRAAVRVGYGASVAHRDTTRMSRWAEGAMDRRAAHDHEGFSSY